MNNGNRCTLNAYGDPGDYVTGGGLIKQYQSTYGDPGIGVVAAVFV